MFEYCLCTACLGAEESGITSIAAVPYSVTHCCSEVQWKAGNRVGHRGAAVPLRHAPPSRTGGGTDPPPG